MVVMGIMVGVAGAAVVAAIIVFQDWAGIPPILSSASGSSGSAEAPAPVAVESSQEEEAERPAKMRRLQVLANSVADEEIDTGSDRGAHMIANDGQGWEGMP